MNNQQTKGTMNKKPTKMQITLVWENESDDCKLQMSVVNEKDGTCHDIRIELATDDTDKPWIKRAMREIIRRVHAANQPEKQRQEIVVGDKLEKLHVVINGDVYPEIGGSETRQLRRQIAVVELYSDILARIAAFAP